MEPPPDWRFPRADAPPKDGAGLLPEPPNQRLQRWKQQLLDLTLRNRLLNFKDTKKSIPLLCPEIHKLEDALVSGGEFRLKPKPEIMGANDPRDAALHRERTGYDALDEFLKREMEQKRLHAALTVEELDARLIEIDRTSRLSLEEGGANTLYLALGFLRWYEVETSDRELLAPILLIPMRMERSSLREGFRLRRLDEDSRINVTLLKRLEQEDILVKGLDPLPEDNDGLDVLAILDRVRQAIIGQPRWDVSNEASLCILTFAKFLMWVDLEKNTAILKGNDVVRHLIETPNESFAQAAFPDENVLDDHYRPADTYCPIDADASQLSAVFAAAEGRSFVLQGPPGTGKSQTITNLIAQELALGRRVLFVSEKMAALNVVRTRLARVGLGPFCLELHSTKASKDSLRRQLREAINVTGNRAPTHWGAETSQLENLRRELNVYVRMLHAERPAGVTAFGAISTLIGLEKAPEVMFSLGSLETVNRDRLGAMRSAVTSLKHMAEEADLEPDHPLRTVGIGQWSFSLPDEARSAASAVREAAQALEKAASTPLEGLGFRSDAASQRDYSYASSLVALLETSPSPTKDLLNEPLWLELRSRLESWITRGRSRDSTRAAILKSWSDSFLSEDHASLLGLLARANTAGFLRRWFLRRKVRKQLAPLRRAARLPDLVSAEADLNNAIALRKQTARLSDPTSEAARLFGRHWKKGEANWNTLEHLLAWAEEFRNTVAMLPHADPNYGLELRSRLASLASEGANLFRPGGASHVASMAFREALKRLQETRAVFQRLLEIDDAAAWGGPEAPDYLGIVIGHAKRVLESIDRLRDWCSYEGAREHVTGLGLKSLGDALHSGEVTPGNLELAFEKSFARWLFGAIASVEPVLARFHGTQHAAKIDEFRKLDEHIRDLSQQIVLSRLHSNLPKGEIASERMKSPEAGKLQRFVMGGRMSIRRLFQDCPSKLALYKPCVLMSPLSVAQFLGPEFPPFDLVVFDEASQMPVWEAIGAIARGKQLIVVGDSKQLPPTTFFDKKTEEDLDPDDGEVVDEESILDECIGAQIHALTLKWHYRSRHESLIAFSNQRYYEGKLLTFPSAVAGSPQLGVSWREVPGGVYESGTYRRTNRAEADVLVAEVVRRLTDPVERERSLGVVTFSIAQQRLVEDLLEKARAGHPEIESFFTREREPLFVKNLETVQGDERDVIFFSICYGPDGQGRVALRFGPLNAKGGERRLNVAITRARQQLVVFSTLRPDQIDLSRTSAIGVRDLKAFLDYAHRGPAALEEQARVSPTVSCESPFEQAVYNSLTARGWVLHKQVGCSGYRIDLAVVHPERPGRYVLGIECDGANYHSSHTARDRDRLRGAVLADLGWKLHRIWSTDWWLDAHRQLEKAETAVREAISSMPPDGDVPGSVEFRGEK